MCEFKMYNVKCIAINLLIFIDNNKNLICEFCHAGHGISLMRLVYLGIVTWWANYGRTVFKLSQSVCLEFLYCKFLLLIGEHELQCRYISGRLITAT